MVSGLPSAIVADADTGGERLWDRQHYHPVVGEKVPIDGVAESRLVKHGAVAFLVVH